MLTLRNCGRSTDKIRQIQKAWGMHIALKALLLTTALGFATAAGAVDQPT